MMIATTARFAGLLSAASLLVAPAAFAAHHPAHAKHPVTAGAWSFPSCSIARAPEYEYIYSGDPCVAGPAVVESGPNAATVPVTGATPAHVGEWRFPGCADSVEYEYIQSQCQL